MEKTEVSLFSIIMVAGTFLAFVIGSGFATGQEILQYFTVYGNGSFLAIIVFCIIGSLMNTEFITTGQREQFARIDGVYKYYCGKYVGIFYDYFTNLFIYMSYVVMLAGAGATLHQHYGLPAYIGILLTAIITGLTVTLGLNKITKIIGSIGPILIIITILICIPNIFMGPLSITAGINKLTNLEILTAGPTWYVAVFNYLGFGVLWTAPFLSNLGKTLKSQKEAAIGQILGVILFSLTCLIVVFAMFTNIDSMEGSQIPILTLAVNLSPVFGSIFAIVIMLGIYSTAVPLLYMPATRFVDEKVKKGKITIIALAFLGAFIAVTLPFNQLMNYIYVVNGYVGVIFLLFVIFKVIKRFTVEKSPFGVKNTVEK
jgi:uncharacterized membrane protein YkvI